MPEPVTLTATAIATLTFQKFLESGGGELGKRMAGGTIDQLKILHQKLHQTVVDRLRGRSARVDEALGLVEQGDAAALQTVAKNLDVAMDEDADFAEEVRSLAGKIQQEMSVKSENIGVLQTGAVKIEKQVNVNQSGTGNTQNNTFTL